jgi:exoribonuclease R
LIGADAQAHNIPAGWALFAATDRRIPLIQIRAASIEALLNKRIVVSIDQWKTYHRYPRGHKVKELGQVGNKDAEAQALLMQFEVPYYPFSQRYAMHAVDSSTTTTTDSQDSMQSCVQQCA